MTSSCAALVDQVLAENPAQVAAYLEGKETISRWLFGQVMRLAQGQANPGKLQSILEESCSSGRKNELLTSQDR